eukprot:3105836-Ditylum_brightwellii.AAC.1
MPETSAKVHVDTVKYILHKTAVHVFNDKDAIAQAITNIVNILKKTPPNKIPIDLRGEPIVQAFANLAEVLGRKMMSHAPTISSNQKKQQEHQSSFLLPPLAVPQLSPPVVPPPRVPVINMELLSV